MRKDGRSVCAAMAWKVETGNSLVVLKRAVARLPARRSFHPVGKWNPMRKMQACIRSHWNRRCLVWV